MATSTKARRVPLVRRLRALVEAGLERLETGKARQPDLKTMINLTALLERLTSLEAKERDHARTKRAARRIMDDARREALAQRLEALWQREQNKKSHASPAPRRHQ